MTFGTNLRFIRKQQGLTLEDLSKQLNVSINYLSKLEKDKAKIYPWFLPELVNALEIDDMNLLYTELKGNFYSNDYIERKNGNA